MRARLSGALCFAPGFSVRASHGQLPLTSSCIDNRGVLISSGTASKVTLAAAGNESTAAVGGARSGSGVEGTGGRGVSELDVDCDLAGFRFGGCRVGGPRSPRRNDVTEIAPPSS